METWSTVNIQPNIGTNVNAIPRENKFTMKIQENFGQNENMIPMETQSTMKIQMGKL